MTRRQRLDSANYGTTTGPNTTSTISPTPPAIVSQAIIIHQAQTHANHHILHHSSHNACLVDRDIICKPSNNRTLRQNSFNESKSLMARQTSTLSSQTLAPMTSKNSTASSTRSTIALIRGESATSFNKTPVQYCL
jgi:hypothetical protein